jgi:hypothetical protein
MSAQVERPDEEQVLYYESPKNITFHGELDIGMTRQEWANLSEGERQEILSEVVWELVEIGEK